MLPSPVIWFFGTQVTKICRIPRLCSSSAIFRNRLFMLLFLILMKNRIKSSAVQIFLLSPFCCDQLCQILFRDAVIHRTSKPFGRKLGPKTALFKRLSKRRKSRHADHKIGTGKQRRLMLCRHLARQMFCPVRLDQGQICFFPCSLKQLRPPASLSFLDPDSHFR